MVRKYLKYVAPVGYAMYKAAQAGVGDAIRRGTSSAVRGVGTKAMRYLRRRGRSGSFTSKRAVTQQHDIRSGGSKYRFRNSRNWRKFRAKVRAAIQQDNPRHLYQAVYKAGGTTADSVAGFDGVYFLDVNTTNQGDIANVFKDAYSTTPTDSDNYKIYLKSANLDFMLTNTDTTNPCEVDVWECVARRDDNNTGVPGAVWASYFADMDAVGTVTNAHPALTPFSVPNFVRSWKIGKSTKYLVEPGKTISMSMRQRLNRVMSGLKLTNMTVAKGLTRMYFFRVRGIAKNVTPTGSLPASGLTGWSVSWSGLTTIEYQSMPTADESEDIDQSK